VQLGAMMKKGQSNKSGDHILMSCDIFLLAYGERANGRYSGIDFFWMGE